MITRFAPSLTGYLHLGHVLHMIYVWGIAHTKGAKVICRIEDHDQGRARPEYESAILDTIEWLGFTPDLGISVEQAEAASAYRQSDCAEHYTEVLNRLNQQGLIYGCECSRREIAETQSDRADELCYSGTCSEKDLPLEGNTVRFRIPSDEVIFQDLKLGECHQTPAEQCGDFSLRDRTGQWTYQFCCVCDDIRQNVDLVIRGEDILSSTGRQIQLFQLLECTIPQFYHHPLLYDKQGQKLSKRQHAESISQLREAGATPEEILGKAATLGGLTEDFGPINKNEALSLAI